LVTNHPFRPSDLATVSRAFERIEPSLEEIARHLAPDLPHLGPPLGRWVEHPRRPSPFGDRVLLLSAPAGFLMWFGPRAVYMSHVLRFREFAGNRPWRDAIRRFARGCARALGAGGALYCRSDVVGDEAREGVVDGLAVPEVLAALGRRFGPPAFSIEEMYVPDSPGYYVEYFAGDVTADAGCHW
jgi:hypothetical protein